MSLNRVNHERREKILYRRRDRGFQWPPVERAAAPPTLRLDARLEAETLLRLVPIPFATQDRTGVRARLVGRQADGSKLRSGVIASGISRRDISGWPGGNAAKPAAGAGIKRLLKCASLSARKFHTLIWGARAPRVLFGAPRPKLAPAAFTILSAPLTPNPWARRRREHAGARVLPEPVSYNFIFSAIFAIFVVNELRHLG